MQVATHIARMKESATLAVAARAAQMRAQGLDVVGMSTGEPDFPTPGPIVRAAVAALEAGQTKYAPVAGTKEAREAVARKLREENGIACDASHCTVTVGAKHAVAMALQALIEPLAGQEFILPTPAWVSYRPLIELAGGTCIEVFAGAEQGYKVRPGQVEAAITPRTVGIILNSPSNPCGVAYAPAELRALADVLARHERVAILTDEIYEKLVYPEVDPAAGHWSIGSDPRLAQRTVTVNGLSKAFAMTGWRLGYLCAPGDGGRLAKEVIKLQGQTTNAVPTFLLPALVEALSPRSAPAIEEMRKAFAARARMVHRLLSAIPRIRSVAPSGAFYAFPDIRACIGMHTPGGRTIGSAAEFATALLEESLLAVVAGEEFGAPGHIRLSFACADAQIEEGLSRLGAFVASLT